jgi:Peptidase S24-like
VTTTVSLPSGDELVAIAGLWRAAGREVVTSFLGKSMLPTIAPGVEVTIDCARHWNIGDIIAYVADGRVVVHRIEVVSADRRTLLTRGDNRRVPDDPFDPSHTVIGVITRIRSGDQWIVPAPPPQSWLRKKIMGAALGALPRGSDHCRRRLRLFRVTGRIARAVARVLCFGHS